MFNHFFSQSLWNHQTRFFVEYRRHYNRDWVGRRLVLPAWLLLLGIFGVLCGLAYIAITARAAPTPPIILNVFPDHVYIDQNTVITITGAGFVDTPIVTVGSCENATVVLTDVTYLTQTTLTATVPAGLQESNYILQCYNKLSNSMSLL